MMIGRIARRIATFCSLGKVLLADESGSVQRLQMAVPGTATVGASTPDGVKSVQLFGIASSPQPGADAVVIFLGGNGSKGVVIASNDQRYRPTGLLPGEVMIYDAFGHSIHMTAAGIVSTGNWTHNGDFSSTGALNNNGKNVGGTHQHLDSGGSGLGGVPK